MDAFEALCAALVPLATAEGLTLKQFERLTVPSVGQTGRIEVVIGDERRNVDWYGFGHGPEHLGGWRVGGEASPAVVKRLSLIRRLTNAGAVPFDGQFKRLIRGGAQGVSVVDGGPGRLPDEARRTLGYKAGFELARFIGRDKGWVAPDVGTAYVDMKALADGARAAGNTDRAAVAGRDPGVDGTGAGRWATAWGAAQPIRTVAWLQGRDLGDASIALVGFGGEVGDRLFRELLYATRFGYLTDRDGAYETLAGRFDAEGRHLWARDGHPLAAYPGLTCVDRDDVLYSEVDYLVLADAAPRIGESGAHRIRARNVVVLGDDAVTREAAEILWARGVRAWSAVTVAGGDGLFVGARHRARVRGALRPGAGTCPPERRVGSQGVPRGGRAPWH